MKLSSLSKTEFYRSSLRYLALLLAFIMVLGFWEKEMSNKAGQVSPTALVGSLFSGQLCAFWIRCRRAEAIGLAALEHSMKK